MTLLAQIDLGQIEQTEQEQARNGGTKWARLAVMVLGCLLWAGLCYWLAVMMGDWQTGLLVLALGFGGSLVSYPIVLLRNEALADTPELPKCPACSGVLVGHAALLKRTGRCCHCGAALLPNAAEAGEEGLLNLQTFASALQNARERRRKEMAVCRKWLTPLGVILGAIVCAMAIWAFFMGNAFAGAKFVFQVSAAFSFASMTALALLDFRSSPKLVRCPSCQKLLSSRDRRHNFSAQAVATGCCPHCRARLFCHAQPLPNAGIVGLEQFREAKRAYQRYDRLWGGIAIFGMILGIAVGLCINTAPKQSPDEMRLFISFLVLFFGSLAFCILMCFRAARQLGPSCPKCGASLNGNKHVLLFGDCPRCQAPILHP